MKFVIRACEPSDQPRVASLIANVLAEHRFDFAQVGALDEDFSSLGSLGERSGFWLGEAGSQVLGTVAIRPKDGDRCKLKRLYVRADWRGMGIGEALYCHAEDFARAAGYKRIWLDSSRRFDRAQRLYLRHGFQLLEQLDNEWEDTRYEKLLQHE